MPRPLPRNNVARKWCCQGDWLKSKVAGFRQGFARCKGKQGNVMAKRYYQQPGSETNDEALAKAANDPNCKNQQECLEALARRKALKAAQEEREAARAVQEKIRRETVRAE